MDSHSLDDEHMHNAQRKINRCMFFLSYPVIVLHIGWGNGYSGMSVASR